SLCHTPKQISRRNRCVKGQMTYTIAFILKGLPMSSMTRVPGKNGSMNRNRRDIGDTFQGSEIVVNQGWRSELRNSSYPFGWAMRTVIGNQKQNEMARTLKTTDMTSDAGGTVAIIR